MPTYAIGDIQGCLGALKALLAHIDYCPDHDTLWFAGDLVNRGPQSLETLRFIKALPRKQVVLGNHDCHLLALANGLFPDYKFHTLAGILAAPDCTELISWLRQQPFLHYDAKFDVTMVHAGLPPAWSIEDAISQARFLESVLRGKDYKTLLVEMYGAVPHPWNADYEGWDRCRFVINALTRIRYVDAAGRMNFKEKRSPEQLDTTHLYPWFAHPKRRSQGSRILFGHWAALRGHSPTPDVIALDGGCIWGHQLIAHRLDDNQRFAIDARPEWINADIS